jgi:hypothetical protein
VFDPATNGLESGGDAAVVDAGSGARIDLEQLGADDRAGEIVGDELAELAGLEDVFANAGEVGGPGRELGRNDVAAGESIFDDLDVANVGSEQRLHLRAIDRGQRCDFIGGAFQLGEEWRGENITLTHDQGDEHAVRAAKLALIFRERPDVGMVERQRFVETRVDAQMGGEKRHDRRQRGESPDERGAPAKHPGGESFEHRWRRAS